MAKKNVKSKDRLGKLNVYEVKGSKNSDKKLRMKKIQVFLLVLLVIVGVAAIFAALKVFTFGMFGKSSLHGELAARVNDKPITMQELNTEYDRLPLQYKYALTKEQFLSQMIDKQLISEEAARQGLGVSEDDVMVMVNEFMQENNITEEEFEELLKNQSITYSELKANVRDQLLVDKVIDNSIRSKVNVTPEKIKAYYDENPELFIVPEMASVKHILLTFNANLSEQQLKEKAQMVLGMIKEDRSNFCDLVLKYSEDAGSIENCGEYVFTKGRMDPDFDERAFAQPIGEISVVKTVYGEHVLWTVNKTPEQQVPLDVVGPQIEQLLVGQEEKNLYTQFVLDLRSKAKIINYLESQDQAAELSEENSELGKAVTETVAETEAIIEEPAITEEPDVVETQPVVQETPAQGSIDCLLEKAVLYGAYWDSSTKKQKDAFGSSASKINYVECGVSGDYRTQQEACVAKGIEAYPTWIIGGNKYLGFDTPDNLAKLAGC